MCLLVNLALNAVNYILLPFTQNENHRIQQVIGDKHVKSSKIHLTVINIGNLFVAHGQTHARVVDLFCDYNF